MQTIFDADLVATVALDDAGRIQGLKLEEYRVFPDAGGRAADTQVYRQTEVLRLVAQTVATNILAGKHERIFKILQSAGTGDPGQLLNDLRTIDFAQGTEVPADLKAVHRKAACRPAGI